MESGIYTITNKVNGKIYVGRAIGWKSRIECHKCDLKYNRHRNAHLQNAYNKHGLENFSFELLEEYEPEFLCSMENYWCNLLNSHHKDFGYNIQPTNPCGNMSHSIETKQKMGKSQKGRIISEEAKRKLSLAMSGRKTGRTPSKKVKEILSKYNKGRKWTEEEIMRRSLTVSKPIVQLTKDGEFIREWISATEAAKNFNVDTNAIFIVLSKPDRSSCNSKWYRLEDYIKIIKIIKYYE